MKRVKWAAVMLALCLAALVGLSGSRMTVSAEGADGAALYKSKCASCHGADGKGQTGYGKAQKLRDLGSAEVQSQSDAQLEETTAKGKGKMPGYEKSLGADGVKAVVAFIRTLKS
jgi:cytochrome c6